MEEVEVLEIEEDKNVESILTNESVSRDAMLKMANQVLEKQSGNMITYTNLLEKMKRMQEDYLLLKVETQNLEKQIQNLKKVQKKRENEVVQLRLENEQNKKKRSALQSLLQVLLNTYGVHEVMNILGISYIKLKEYLDD